MLSASTTGDQNYILHNQHTNFIVSNMLMNDLATYINSNQTTYYNHGSYNRQVKV